MNADEIVKEARRLHADWAAFDIMRHGGREGAKSDNGEAERKFMLWLVDDFPAMCDLIESLQAQLAEANKRIETKETLLRLQGTTMSMLSSDKDMLIHKLRDAESKLAASQRRERAAVEYCKSPHYGDGNYYCGIDSACQEVLDILRGPVAGEESR